jgi:hypothetical protein
MRGWRLCEYAGEYYVNSDTLNDYGIMEFSRIMALPGLICLNDSSLWWGTKPVLSGNSNGWYPFFADLTLLFQSLNIYYGDMFYIVSLYF